MSDAMETLAAIVTLEGEIKRLRALNAELVAALEGASKSLFAAQSAIIDAIARAKP